MKKLMIIVATMCAIIVTGCKTQQTTQTMYTTSYSIGTATAMVCNTTKIDDTSRNAIIDIMNIVDDCVPQTNQTFEAAWTPIAQAHTDQLIADGKIDKKQGKIIMSAFQTIVMGIDYVFDVKYPQARLYTDLVEACVHGFSDGFLTVFKPANTFSSSNTNVIVDRDAYNYLLNAKKK